MADRDVVIVDYEPAHGAYIAANIRPMDRREIHYLAMISPEVAIRVTTANAVAAWTALLNGVPVAIFGVNRRTRLSTIGVPWMLATPEIDKVPVKLQRVTVEYVARMFRAFPVMVNYVLAENTRTVRWLRAVGFDMEEARPYGAFGAAFIRFGKGLSNVR